MLSNSFCAMPERLSTNAASRRSGGRRLHVRRSKKYEQIGRGGRAEQRGRRGNHKTGWHDIGGEENKLIKKRKRGNNNKSRQNNKDFSALPLGHAQNMLRNLPDP